MIQSWSVPMWDTLAVGTSKSQNHCLWYVNCIIGTNHQIILSCNYLDNQQIHNGLNYRGIRLGDPVLLEVVNLILVPKLRFHISHDLNSLHKLKSILIHVFLLLRILQNLSMEPSMEWWCSPWATQASSRQWCQNPWWESSSMPSVSWDRGSSWGLTRSCFPMSRTMSWLSNGCLKRIYWVSCNF